MDGHYHGEGEWRNGLCSHVCGGDCATCVSRVLLSLGIQADVVQWGAFCCSCFLFGRSSERLDKFPDLNKDHYNLFNANCAVLFLASYVHLGWLPIMLKRQEMRQKFNIRGDGCQDCLISYFCACCKRSQGCRARVGNALTLSPFLFQVHSAKWTWRSRTVPGQLTKAD